MRCSPRGTITIARTAVEGGTPHGREGYHTGRVPARSTAAVGGGAGGGVGGGVDEKGFTEGVQELALLAAVMEPYQVGQDELLGRFAGVSVGVEKMERLVEQEGQRAERLLREVPAEGPGVEGAAAAGPCYV